MKNIDILKTLISKELFLKVGHISLGPMREITQAFNAGDLTCDDLETLAEAFKGIDEYWAEKRYSKTH